MTTCPFCNHDPYHYVGNGVGTEAVAITCCEPGIAFFSRERAEAVTVSGDEFSEIGTKLLDLRRERAALDAIRDLEPGTQEWVDGKVSPEECRRILGEVFMIARRL